MTNANLTGSTDPVIYTPTSEERTLAILTHVLSIFFGFIPALIIWLIKKDDSKYVSEHAKESLNNSITFFLVCIVLAITIIGIFLIWIVMLVRVVFCIIATINASDNKIYRYPLTWRVIK